MENKSTASKEYQIWWEANKERILEKDRLDHEMGYKASIVKHLKTAT